MPQITWGYLFQTFSKIVCRLAGHAQSGDMGDPFQLILNRGIQFGVPVSVYIAPETGNAIEEFLAVSGGEPAPFPILDHQ